MKFLVLLSMVYFIGAAPVENAEEAEVELLRRLVDLLVDSKKDDLTNISVNKRMIWDFKEENTLESRIAESANILATNPGTIPVIVQKAPDSDIVQDIDKHKFLVSKDILFMELEHIIRERINFPDRGRNDPRERLFLYVNDVLVTARATIGQLYEAQKDADGFLYVAYSGIW